MWLQSGSFIFNPDLVDMIHKSGKNEEGKYELVFILSGHAYAIYFRNEQQLNKEFDRLLLTLECFDILKPKEENDPSVRSSDTDEKSQG